MKRPFYLTKDQVKQMVNWAFEHRKKTAIRDKLIIELLFKCGLISNELRNLRIEDIRNNNSIDIEKPKGGDKKKRIVLIDDDLKSWTSTYVRQEGRKKVVSFVQISRNRFPIDQSGALSKTLERSL